MPVSRSSDIFIPAISMASVLYPTGAGEMYSALTASASARYSSTEARSNVTHCGAWRDVLHDGRWCGMHYVRRRHRRNVLVETVRE